MIHRVSRDSSLWLNPQRIFLDICMIRPFYVGRKTFDDMLIATINVTIAVYPEGIIYAYQILISIIWWMNTHMLLLRSFKRFYGLAENAVDGAFTEVFDNLQISSVRIGNSNETSLC